MLQKGYQVTFFTRQDCTIGHQPLGQWLLELSRELGLKGATLSGALEGVGRDGHVHMVNMYDISEQPLKIVMVVSADEQRKLFQRLEQEPVSLFCTVTAVEYGMVGGLAEPAPQKIP